MKYSELQRKSKDELEKLLNDNRTDLQKIQFTVASGQEKNVRKLRILKRQISQILTALKNGQYGQAE